MKKLLTILFILITIVSNATNWYVDNTAGGTNSGTLANPWTSLASISWASIAAGDSILLKCGDTFNEKFVIGKSGSAGSPIIISSYGTGAKPIITGFTSVTSWTNIGGNIWESTSAVTTSSSLNMVTVNGNFQPIGRWPKVTASNSGYLNIDSHSSNTSITSSGLSGASDYSGGEIVIRKNNWILDRETISSMSGTTVNFSNNNTAYPVQNNYGFFFQNNVNACTQQGDWYFNSTTKKIGMYSVGDPTGVKVSAIDTLVSIYNQKNYITLLNINITGANKIGLFISISQYSNIKNCSVTYCGVDGISLTDGGAAQFQANYGTINNDSVRHCMSRGIHLSSRIGTTTTNNVMDSCGMIAGMGVSGDHQYVGISYVGDSSLVRYNKISNIGYNGIGINAKADSVDKNYITNTCMIKNDGAAIYVIGGDRTGTVISNNIIDSVPGLTNGTPNGSNAEGIYVDDVGFNITISNNTVARSGEAGIFTNGGHDLTVKNNIVYNNGAQFRAITFSGTPFNLSLKNNKFVARAGSQYSLTTSAAASTWFTNTDSNYHARPIDDNLVFNINGTTYNLSGWQTYSGQDAHSKKSPKTITSTDSIELVYNPNNYDSTVTLSAVYMGVDTTLYSGSITLHAYSSAVLIYKQALTVLYDTTRAIKYKKARLRFSYNNPVKDYLNMNIPSGYRQPVYFTLNDIWGREFIKKKVQLERGSNKVVFDLSRLASAVYILTMSDIYDEFDHFKILKVQ